MGNMSCARILHFIIILLIMEWAICCCGENTTFGCIENERKALLKLRATLTDPSNRLSSWKTEDCCTWQGVACHKITGHVIGLDLSGWDLTINNLIWVSNLSSLEHLDMSYVNLSQTKGLFQVLNMLPSIVVLALSGSGLNNTHLPHGCANSSLLPNIQHLDLGWNSFVGEFPCFLQNMTSLRVLDLSYNMYSSSNTYLPRLRGLVNLDLGGNSLHYTADWISKLFSGKCHLKSLSLSGNKFYGEISGLFENSSRCWNKKLEILNLGSNEFHGHLPEELGELTQLNYLDLSDNAYNGPVPTSLGKLRALSYLLLHDNQLSGEIPISLGQLSNLERIDLSFNLLNATLSEAHFAKLSKLESLLLGSSTVINFSIGFNWVPPFGLRDLSLKSSKIGGQFPQWIRMQKMLENLDMSNCSISGTIPKWLRFKNLTSLSLSNNHIEGPIPDSLCEMKALKVLDLFENHLSGNLPNCLTNLQNLRVMVLSSNRLSGFIPSSFGQAKSLIWLHLNNNNFTGRLPSTLKNHTKLIVLDVGNNKLAGKLPEWIGKSLTELRVLILRNNEFFGAIPFALCQLSKLQVMDLANNKLIGKVPSCFGNFISMVKGRMVAAGFAGEMFSQVMKGAELEYTTNSIYVVNLDLSSNYLSGEIPLELTNLSALLGLNLSHNHLGGRIPEKIGNMRSLESLDLSSNNLFGTVPSGLSNLNFLTYLNLSHNNLSGKIPTGNQIQTLDNPSIYDGNPRLCGSPLLKKCDDGGESKSPNIEDKGVSVDEEDKFEKIVFYGVVVSGVAIGFWGFIGVLVFNKRWRQTYFQYIQVVIDKVLGS